MGGKRSRNMRQLPVLSLPADCHPTGEKDGPPDATGGFFVVRWSVDGIPEMTTGYTMRNSKGRRGKYRGGHVCSASMAHALCPIGRVFLSF
jgi:hypothetical protein